MVNLVTGFFSDLVQKDSQFIFNFDGKPYSFTQLSQGYCESPAIYNSTLKDSLAQLQISPGSVLLQYIDDHGTNTGPGRNLAQRIVW